MRKLMAVAVAYGSSTLLLLFGEVLLARSANPAEFGDYWLIKNAVPLVTALALLGYEQALTRESAVRARPAHFEGMDRFFVLRAVAISSAVVAYLVLAAGLAPFAAASLGLASAGSVIASYVSASMRATGSAGGAAFVLQGYRTLMGATLVIAWGRLSEGQAPWALAVSAGLVACWSLVVNQRFSNPWTPNHTERRAMARLGYGFTLGMVALAASDWVDQAMVTQFTDSATNGLYAQAKLVSAYPLSSLGSILGFLAIPFIARHPDLTAERVRQWYSAALLGVAGLVLITGPISLACLHYLFAGSLGIPPVIVLVLAGAARLAYILPSAIVGALGTARLVGYSGGAAALALGLQIACTLALGGVLGWALAAALGLLASATTRLLATTALASMAIHEKRGS